MSHIQIKQNQDEQIVRQRLFIFQSLFGLQRLKYSFPMIHFISCKDNLNVYTDVKWVGVAK